MKHKTGFKILLVIACIILTILEFVIIFKMPFGMSLNTTWTPDVWFFMIFYIFNTIATIIFIVYTIKVFLKDSYDPNDTLGF